MDLATWLALIFGIFGVIVWVAGEKLSAWTRLIVGGLFIILALALAYPELTRDDDLPPPTPIPTVTAGGIETPTVLPTPIPTNVPTVSPLLYEDNFDDASRWVEEEGMEITNGSLFIAPGHDAVPNNPLELTDLVDAGFVFQSRFYIPASGSMAYYLKHQRFDCDHWNCSIQIALYFGRGDPEVAIRRFLGDRPGEQLDIRKIFTSSLDPDGWNELTVWGKGSSYDLYINDVFVISFEDATYEAGSIIIDNAEDSSGEIEIDYIRIYEGEQ